MAGYVPFKLMKVYERKDTQDDANILDCLSAMAVSGSVGDFHAYTHEWTKSVNRGGLFQAALQLSPFSGNWRFSLEVFCPNICLEEV